jgi:hypothetical protein
MAGFSFAAHPAAFAIAVSFRAEATVATSFHTNQNLSRGYYRDAADLSAKIIECYSLPAIKFAPLM